MELHYKKYDRSEGASDAQLPLLILHGIFGAGGNWHTLSKNIFSSDRDVYTIDQRNHGRSPHHDSFSFDDMVGDLVEFMDLLELESASILGHSMGGKTAMYFALTHPDRVDQLIVADIAPVAYPDLHSHLFIALRGLDPAQYSNRDEIDEILSRTIESEPVRQFLLKNIVRKHGTLAWAMNLEAIFQAYPVLRGEVQGWPPFSGESLFIRGARSGYILDEHFPSIYHLFPAAEIKTISDSGHWLHAERPEIFAGMVESFLNNGSRSSEYRTNRPR